MSLVRGEVFAGVDPLLAPIDAQMPAGLFDIEDETYQAIDQEMVKYGGLHQASIDWPYIEEAACQYLGRQCKHFRILGHLLSAWLRAGRWESWSDGLGLLAGMVERYWETAHPKPGPTGYLAKRKQVKLMLERLAEALPALPSASPDAAPLRQARAALLRLQGCAAAQLDAQAIAALERALARRADACAQLSVLAMPSSPKTQALTWPSMPGPAGNDRETRRSALALAESINQQDLYDPTGYQLRRFALWGHIQTAPSARRERCTELAGVPKDLAESYQEALAATAVEPALLLRIEKSVAASPFWIRGSYLAASVALRLAMEEVADAIRLASARFVRRVPGLMNLCFSDGSAFVDAQTRAWLTAQQAAQAAGPAHEYAGLREELVAQLAREGVEVVLLRLQTLQAGQCAPRQRCHASVIAADLLGARGLTWLADDLYANAARLMATTPAHAWEPDLYQRLLRSDGLAAAVTQDI